ncbi:hypothetical protein M8C21_026220 [Ambrosia artemisiifolia]|uniref:Uncharacterized protein n=1 Tax=Ambrosia artemisiifolia TaxID=4212 RepID=A0AAD5G3Y1_AMBAR|nr:hypothetical protein M8C21_026220 [Ambrosia artemisiifolia]
MCLSGLLDMCCYTGGFALNAACGHALDITGVDRKCNQSFDGDFTTIYTKVDRGSQFSLDIVYARNMVL